MGPAHAGVLIANNHALAGKAQRPDRRSVDVEHAPLGGVGGVGVAGRDAKFFNDRIFDPASGHIGVDARHVRARGEQLDQRAVGRGNEHVGRPERLVSNAPGFEKLLKANLSASGMLSKRVVNKPAAGILVLHCIGRADVGLIGEQDDDRRTLAVGRVSQHLRRDLGGGGLQEQLLHIAQQW